jgi:hypothetical protein
MVFSGASAWENYKLYIDGALKTNYTLTNPTSTIGGGNNLIITGANGGATNNSYSIIRIYNRALNSGEVLLNYNAMKQRFGITS